MGGSFILEFNNIRWFLGTGFVNVQVEVWPDGDTEIRHGTASTSGNNHACGLEDDSIGVALPCAGSPYGSTGVTSGGAWPTNQCRNFACGGGGGGGECDLSPIEAKLDDGTSFVDDGEFDSGISDVIDAIGDSESTIITTISAEITDLGDIISDFEVVLDDLTLAIGDTQEAMCAAIDLLMTPQGRRCSDTYLCGFGKWNEGLEDVPDPEACMDEGEEEEETFAPETSVDK
jgi:hypothetical protein